MHPKSNAREIVVTGDVAQVAIITKAIAGSILQSVCDGIHSRVRRTDKKCDEYYTGCVNNALLQQPASFHDRVGSA